VSLRQTGPGTGPATIERIGGVVAARRPPLAGQSWGRLAESATVKIDLRGKVALVTGSSSGIGLAIARGLAKAGASVVVNGRSQGRADGAVNALKQAVAGADVGAIGADVSTSEGCERLRKAVPAVDILVNNAGIYQPKDFFEISDDDWSRYFQSNVMSGVRLSRDYLHGMLQSNWGRIVFISSESALYLYIPKEMIHYGFSKKAQLAVSRGLAELTVGSGVTVNAVLPGPTRSEGVDAMLRSMAAQRGISVEEVGTAFVKEHRPTSLLQRFASVDEVASMVIYVCSKEASATNGAALRVEGGIVRTIA
jgi:NAD(P)-dependent dehydrogenase (short-subunit alcohol dehydrogenase family)